MSRKLLIALGFLLMIMLVVGWYFFDSVRWHRYDLQRIAKSNEVLYGYEELSNMTFRKLQNLTDSVMRGSPGQPLGESGDAVELRNAVSRVQQGIAEELAFVKGEDESPELETLAEVGRVVEELVRSGEIIDMALAQGRTGEAETELGRLRAEGFAARFQVLIRQAIAEQRAEVEAVHWEAVSLADAITRLLPALMAFIVAVTVTAGYRLSRNLARSMGKLQDGLAEFTGGNLQHRIPDIREREFHELARALNILAKDLSEHLAGLDRANRRLEERIEERTRALQESNRKLDRVDENRRKLLADISHEFRTPLTVIKGESEIALRGENKAGAEYRASLERIIQQADHTTRMIDDLLFIARADAGEPRLDLRSVAVPGLVEEVCMDFRARAGEKQVAIDLSGNTVKAVVRGDSGRLRQVFAILLDNALRYSHAGGRVEVTAVTGGNELAVTVRDQGIGLTEAEAAQAFERFYRGAQGNGHAQGTGLGLPLAKAIVEAHNGSISLKGEPGKGAAATVLLPIEGHLRAVA